MSVKNILARSLGIRMKSDEVKKLEDSRVERLFPAPGVPMSFPNSALSLTFDTN